MLPERTQIPSEHFAGRKLNEIAFSSFLTDVSLSLLRHSDQLLYIFSEEGAGVNQFKPFIEHMMQLSQIPISVKRFDAGEDFKFLCHLFTTPRSVKALKLH